ncbi:hypothetical protein LCGC14_0232250 [marine sediment metagenome]|uniref:Uncharacterized protein n=1 Tax=marine sediment metagenome TaxID=412755 RepID=A0A0F9URG4_9ZZZZ
MATEVRKKGKSGNKKHGRNKRACEAYHARGQREKNKILKIKRHLKKYPTDVAAAAKLKSLK